MPEPTIRYGKLTILGPLSPTNTRRVIARCDCGETVPVNLGDLERGRIKSCGCLSRKQPRHGEAKLGRRTRLYRQWGSMWTRCSTPERYPSYVGRSVFPAWKDYTVFKTWIEENLGPCPEGFTLDRIDNDGNYEPGNLRWASPATQGRNRNDNHVITANGVTKCIAEWARDLGCGTPTIHQRLRIGWTPEAAVTTPLRIYNRKPK